ncbi:MAG: helix-turn-helix domain-containing protein [Pseudomonadota bacterium]
MPWKVINQMDLKIQLVHDWDEGYFSISALSQKYGISRPTVYKWLKRYKHSGIGGLKEESRAPKHCPNRTPLYRNDYNHDRPHESLHDQTPSDC